MQLKKTVIHYWSGEIQKKDGIEKNGDHKYRKPRPALGCRAPEERNTIFWTFKYNFKFIVWLSNIHSNIITQKNIY